MAFLQFRHLNSLAMMLILAATGTVSLTHIALVAFSTIYIYFLSKFSFPRLSEPHEKPVFNPKSSLLPRYILFAAILGLLLPIIYIFVGIYKGDTDSIKAAVPHVFLLATQVFLEGVSASCKLSLPVRVFVPVFYNSVRMFALVEWLKGEFSKGGNGARVYAGKGLAVGNFVLWGYNLFGFLLPVYLPKAFQQYYGASKTDKALD